MGTVRITEDLGGCTVSFCQRAGRVPGLALQLLGAQIGVLVGPALGSEVFLLGVFIGSLGTMLSWCWMPRGTIRVSPHALEVRAFIGALPWRARARVLREDPVVQTRQVGRLHDQPVHRVRIEMGSRSLTLGQMLVDAEDIGRLRSALIQGLQPLGADTDVPLELLRLADDPDKN